MSYSSAVAQLYELGHELARTPSHKFDLAHMRVLLEALGSPHRQFRSVLVAGTNGKGSTAATLASIVRAAGHRTGLYTSPHLVRINERIRINGEPISDADFTRAHRQVETAAVSLVQQAKLPWHPSFFEVLTAMAFLHFAGASGPDLSGPGLCGPGLRPGETAPQPVDLAVLEVGMGGRLDATNVVEPMVSVITDIALDHQKFLGNTVREIAGEKAGIIRRGGTVVTLPQHPEANDVIGNTILQRDAHAVSAVPYVPPLSPGSTLETSRNNRSAMTFETCHSERSEESAVDVCHSDLENCHSDPERAQRVEGEESAVDVCHSDLENCHSDPERAQRFEGEESAVDVCHSDLENCHSDPERAPRVEGEESAVDVCHSDLENCHSDPERAPRVEGEESAFAHNSQLATRNSYPLSVMGEEITVASPLLGRHQWRNLALAIATAVELNLAGLRITPRDIERGIAETRWPGRFQIVTLPRLSEPAPASGHAPAEGIDHPITRSPDHPIAATDHPIARSPDHPITATCVLDVAHNPAGAWALRAALSQNFEGRPLLFVFGAMRDKEIAEMAEILFPLAERVFATCAENPRSATAEQIRDSAARTGAEIELAASVPAAIEAARRRAPAAAVVVITGSIYVVGEAMQALGLSPA